MEKLEFDDDFTEDEINALIAEQLRLEKEFGIDEEFMGTDEFQGF